MFCSRTRHHGAFSLFSNLFNETSKPSLLTSLFSSKSSPNIPNPKSATAKRPPSLATQNLQETSLTVSTATSPVASICSLLSNSVTEPVKIESLLSDYKGMLNSDIVLQVLRSYKQLGRVRTLEFFSWAGMQMGFKFDDCVIEYMVDFLGRRKLFDDMKCFLMTVLVQNGRVTCRAFSICIRFLGRQGRFREALCLFQEMETKFNCRPDNFVCNNMLYVLCKKEASGELIDVALSIFRGIESPDTYSYGNVLVGLCKFGRFETAIEVFQEMGRAGLVPTRSAVNFLMKELCLLSAKEGAVNEVRVNSSRKPYTILVPNLGSKSGAIRPAVGVFWAVYDLGLLPSTFVIIQLMTELCRLGKMAEAFEILKVVEERKLSCVAEGYAIVMQALCEYRLVEEVSHLFGRMLSLDLKPKLVVYNSVICMLCKLGKLDDAQRVFQIMNKKRCIPDSVTYTALVHAYGEARNWEVAYDLLIEMLGLGWIPHFHAYTLVDKLLREHGRMDLSNKLERKLDSQILHKHCKAGQLESACEKLRSMIEKGFCPPMYVRVAFEHAFQKYGKLEMARELLQKMDKVCEPSKAEVS
ncbi:unnamed protein product [Dovyalis caffra]|uniref:Pentatricopeptide repeat-containing protein n=1 Tax=Dovyalis caffra TaxID=77055 RepID=A0AAV1QM29_9ROSI|nr:unnamed protein product [Dovyalis caffra]